MKNWKSVVSVLAGVAAVIAISAFGATSAGTQPYKADYMASWVQAIGSIAAILGALRIASGQRADSERSQEQQKQAERARKFDERIDRIELVLLLGAEAIVSVNAMERAVTIQKIPYFSNGVIGFAFKEINTVVAQLSNIQMDALGNADISRDVIRLMRTLRMLLLQMPNVEGVSMPEDLNIPSVRTRIENYLGNIRLHRDAIEKARQLAMLGE